MKKNYIILFLINFICFGAFSQENIAPKASAVQTSFVSTWENLYAVNDGYEPSGSSDKGPGAYGNWNYSEHFNEWNWVEYDFADFYMIAQSDIYWWTDGGGIQIPYDTYLLYWNVFTGDWETPRNVSGNGVLSDQYNVTSFTPVLTNKIRVYCISINAQGILEWKVFGQLAENVPVNSTVTINSVLTKGTENLITLTAKDALGNPVSGYHFNMDVAITADIADSNEEYQIGGTSYTSNTSEIELGSTDANGVLTLPVSFPATIDPNDGAELVFSLDNKLAEIARFNYFEPGMVSPVLNADVTDNSVDSPIDISFNDDAAWRGKITAVKVNGQVLSTADYYVSAGVLTLKPMAGNVLLTKSGTKTVSIEAIGYETTAVDQIICAGAVSEKTSFIDSTVKIYRPSTTRIPVYAYDAYMNPVEGYSFRYDITLVNNDATTDEVFFVQGEAVTANSQGNILSATDSTGKAVIMLKNPATVDVNDGILFQLKMNDIAVLIGDQHGYIRNEDEKAVYYPKELNSNKEFSWDQTMQTDNFTAFWGSKTGPDPLHPLSGASFDPKQILAELESYYSFYVDSMKFILNPDSGNMAKYKFVVILFDTWNSGYASTGSAYGGSVDDVIGAMWMSPMSGFVIAHEFGHACQAMIPIQYPGKGFKNRDDNHQVGMYWEACANFKAYLATGTTGNMITPLFANTSMLQYLSTIDYRQYESVYLPAYIVDKFGKEALGRQWRAADRGDNPFDALQKGLGMTREEMRREAGLWAMHNVTWDYSFGKIIRSTLYGQDASATCRQYTYLQNIEGVTGTYIVPREMAPADYGYNIIPVFPDAGATSITARLSGYDNAPSGGGGWSYGFVAVDADGSPRYGNVALETDGQAMLSIEPTDSLFYLVVTATPVNTNTYAWTPNWVKEYRFPYSLEFENVLPAGHKEGYNSKKNNVAGAPHSNGGGWVASTATVASTAFVGPNAQVLESAKVLANARIEDYAIVQGTAQVKDNAIVRDNAIVGKAAIVSNYAIIEKAARVYGGKVSESAVVTGSAVAFNCKISGNAVMKDLAWITGLTLSGTAIVGGDNISFKTCDNGIYLSQNQKSCNGNLWNDNFNEDINPVIDDYYYPNGDIPLFPDNLQATAISGDAVVLTWDEALDNAAIVNYIVFKNGTAIHQIAGTTDTITGLSPQTAYAFSLRARDNAGNISEESDVVEATTLVSASSLNNSSFNLSIVPNPVKDHFTIELSGRERAQLSIINLLGEEVFATEFAGKIVLYRSDVEKNGIYFVKVKCGNVAQVQKLVVR